MRIHLALCLAVAGCAAAQPQSALSAKRGPNEYCNPCAVPCTPYEMCGGTAVAKAPAPAAKPAPMPVAVAPQASAAATFSPAEGTFTSSQSVELSTTTPGAMIHYTTDGTEPTASSPVYAGPITVGSTTTVKALTTAPGMANSEVASATYSIEPPPPPVAATPPAVAPRVEVTKAKLEIKDKIFFDTGKATIQPTSYPLLDEVAQALKSHAEVAHVDIEGHTDSQGAATVNRKLSQGRAEAVRAYLVDKGIAAERLDAKGLGASRPIADNKTAKGREANRRVEFVITPSM